MIKMKIPDLFVVIFFYASMAIAFIIPIKFFIIDDLIKRYKQKKDVIK